MSSTSSSDNDDCPTLCYGSSLRGTVNAPIYPCVGRRPLVYYAHIPQDRRPEKNRIDKKNNPNCFVKAFRWYTQELVSPQADSTANNVNIGGFAEWLDKKYEEFLHESEREQNSFRFTTKQPSISAKDSLINRSLVEHKARKTKKFSRMKSPWKKKRRFVKDSERYGVCNEHSFEFILRPQDLSRPASECCQKTSCCNRSDATFITSKTAFQTKIKIKSHSMMCITKPRDVFEKQINVITYDGDKDVKKQTSAGKVQKVLETPVLHKPVKLIVNNVYCECMEDKSKLNASNKNKNDSKMKPTITTAETYQSLSPGRPASRLKTNNKETKFADANELTDTELTKTQYKAVTIQKREQADVHCQCSLNNTKINAAFSQHNAIKQQDLPEKGTCIQENYQAPCCQSRRPQQQIFQQQPVEPTASKIAAFNDNANITLNTPILRDFHSLSVQTSDHSIIFHQDDMFGVPLFLKIACGKK